VVVMAIISLLVAILISSLTMALEMSRRTTCSTNLGSIGRRLSMYESQERRFPLVPLNGAGWGVKIGTNREANWFDGAAEDRSPSSCLYLLVKRRISSVKMFTCPSTKEKGSIPAPAAGGSASDQGPAGPRDSYLVR